MHRLIIGALTAILALTIAAPALASQAAADELIGMYETTRDEYMASKSVSEKAPTFLALAGMLAIVDNPGCEMFTTRLMLNAGEWATYWGVVAAEQELGGNLYSATGNVAMGNLRATAEANDAALRDTEYYDACVAS